ncbi:MAG: TRAP-type uncharacterized transport system substrate-binding protein, partial [Flammeovirgaceae bacterium]
MRKAIFRVILLGVFWVSATSCQDSKTYTMATSSESASYLRVGEELSKLFELETDVKIKVLSGENMGSDRNIHLLSNLEVDFAFAQGDTKIKGSDIEDFKGNHHIKTVLPLYPEVLFIIYPDSIEADNLSDLVRGRTVGFGPKGGGTSSFMHRLLQHYGIEDNEYQTVYSAYGENVVSDKISISCALTGFNNQRIYNMLAEGHKIFSLGDPDLAYKGSSVDGFCLIHGPAHPFIIPKFTYMKQPAQPILTVAVDAILYTHEEVDKYVIYNLTEAIFNNKQYLGNKNQLLTQITEDFDGTDLNYPLHEGARMYLERDKPNFIERYSKLIGSILLALVTGIPMVYRTYKQKKKDKIDQFYEL